MFFMLSATSAQLSSSGWRGDATGEACLPKDVINLVRSELVTDINRACKTGKYSTTDGSSCTAPCREAVKNLKGHLCYNALTQSQRKQPRHGGVSLSAMPGTWYGLYPASGVDLIDVEYDASTSTLTGTKLTGNHYVRAGRVSWEATPSGCRVVSSQWAGVYTPRWDPCTMTMWEDHLTIDMGEGESEDADLTFVRARAPLLFQWDERRSPTYGLDDAFAMCHVNTEEASSVLLDALYRTIHHSESTVVLDQLLVAFLVVLVPLLMSYGDGVGGFSIEEHPLLCLVALVYAGLLCSRLIHLGFGSS